MFKGSYYHDLPEMTKSEQLEVAKHISNLLKNALAGKQTEVEHGGKVFQVRTTPNVGGSNPLHTMVTELYSGKVCHQATHGDMNHHDNVIASIQRGEPHFATPEYGSFDDDDDSSDNW
jgi:hypothetical protein